MRHTAMKAAVGRRFAPCHNLRARFINKLKGVTKLVRLDRTRDACGISWVQGALHPAVFKGELRVVNIGVQAVLS